MTELWRIYKRLFVSQFQIFAQYRVQSLLWLLFAVIRPVIFLAAWAAAAEAQGGAIDDYTVGDFAAYYICLTLVRQLTMAWVADDFEYQVRTGQLASRLLRPLHPIHYSVVENIVYKVTTLPMLLPVLVLMAWTFKPTFQTEPVHLLLFIPSLILGAALVFVSSWSIASIGFWTTRLHSITHLWDRLVFLFAGQIAPLALLPAPVAALAYILPFGYMLWAPVEILRGGVTPERALLLIGGQSVWLALSWLGYQLIWRAGLRQFSAVGA